MPTPSPTEKNVAYYADQAERLLRNSRAGQTLEGMKAEIARAEVYARLAAAVAVQAAGVKPDA